jgi:hypothetical protein
MEFRPILSHVLDIRHVDDDDPGVLLEPRGNKAPYLLVEIRPQNRI